MDPKIDPKIEKINRMLELMANDTITPKELEQFLKFVLDFITQAKNSFDSISKENLQKIQDALEIMQTEHSSLSTSMSQEIKDMVIQCDKMCSDMIGEMNKKMSDLEASIPEQTDLSELEQKIKDIEAKIVPFPELVEETGDTIIEKINESEGLIQKERVEGLNEELKRIDSKPRPMGASGSKGILTYVGGTKKGMAQFINFVAGSNITLSSSYQSGLLTLTIISTGGSGFTKLSATETPNSVLTVFTFSTASAQPSFLVVDGVWMQATTALGTVNWTWNNGTKKATLTIPANDDIFGVV